MGLTALKTKVYSTYLLKKYLSFTGDLWLPISNRRLEQAWHRFVCVFKHKV